MQDAETVLDVLRERGRRGLPLERLYRQLFNPQLYLLAYGRLYSNHGAMTPGIDEETVDGMSQTKIARIIDALRHERYRFTPVKRVYIPKKNGKMVSLGLELATRRFFSLHRPICPTTTANRADGAQRRFPSLWKRLCWFLRTLLTIVAIGGRPHCAGLSSESMPATAAPQANRRAGRGRRTRALQFALTDDVRLMLIPTAASAGSSATNRPHPAAPANASCRVPPPPKPPSTPSTPRPCPPEPPQSPTQAATRGPTPPPSPTPTATCGWLRQRHGSLSSRT